LLDNAHEVIRNHSFVLYPSAPFSPVHRYSGDPRNRMQRLGDTRLALLTGHAFDFELPFHRLPLLLVCRLTPYSKQQLTFMREPPRAQHKPSTQIEGQVAV
jgi:hypothetical protein